MTWIKAYNFFASSSEMKITSIYVPSPSLKIEKSKIENHAGGKSTDRTK